MLWESKLSNEIFDAFPTVGNLRWKWGFLPKYWAHWLMYSTVIISKLLLRIQCKWL